MTTIVKDRYPVERLPKDIQDEVQGADAVRLTIETIETDDARRSPKELWADIERLHREHRITPVSIEEAVARIRALRAEWDD